MPENQSIAELLIDDKLVLFLRDMECKITCSTDPMECDSELPEEICRQAFEGQPTAAFLGGNAGIWLNAEKFPYEDVLTRNLIVAHEFGHALILSWYPEDNLSDAANEISANAVALMVLRMLGIDSTQEDLNMLAEFANKNTYKRIRYIEE